MLKLNWTYDATPDEITDLDTPGLGLIPSPFDKRASRKAVKSIAEASGETSSDRSLRTESKTKLKPKVDVSAAQSESSVSQIGKGLAMPKIRVLDSNKSEDSNQLYSAKFKSPSGASRINNP